MGNCATIANIGGVVILFKMFVLSEIRDISMYINILSGVPSPGSTTFTSICGEDSRINLHWDYKTPSLRGVIDLLPHSFPVVTENLSL